MQIKKIYAISIFTLVVLVSLVLLHFLAQKSLVAIPTPFTDRVRTFFFTSNPPEYSSEEEEEYRNKIARIRARNDLQQQVQSDSAETSQEQQEPDSVSGAELLSVSNPMADSIQKIQKNFNIDSQIFQDMVNFINVEKFSTKNFLSFFTEFEEMLLTDLYDLQKRIIPTIRKFVGQTEPMVHNLDKNNKLAFLVDLHEAHHAIVTTLNENFYSGLLQTINILIKERAKNDDYNQQIQSGIFPEVYEGIFFKRLVENITAEDQSIAELFLLYDLSALNSNDLIATKSVFNHLYSNSAQGYNTLIRKSTIVEQFKDSYRIGLLLKLYGSNHKILSENSKKFILLILKIIDKQLNKPLDEAHF